MTTYKEITINVPSDKDTDYYNRTFIIHYPTTINKPLKTFFYFPGTGSNSRSGLQIFNDLVTEGNTIGVYIQGSIGFDGVTTFNTGYDGLKTNSHDVEFVELIYDYLKNNYSDDIDFNRIVAIGFSVGSAFIAKLSITETVSDYFTGFIFESSVNQQDELSLILKQNPKKVIIVYGKNDNLVPYVGGESENELLKGYNYASLNDVFSNWVSVNNCKITENNNTTDYTTQEASNCLNNTFVYSILFNNTGHNLQSEEVSSWNNTIKIEDNDSLAINLLNIIFKPTILESAESEQEVLTENKIKIFKFDMAFFVILIMILIIILVFIKKWI